jgi:phosphatidylglycerophosphate synthase
MKYTYKDIKKSFKEGSSFIASFVMDYVSVPFVWFFSNFTKVTPNQITFIGFFWGLLASFSFFFNKFIIGIIFFELSYIFDCIDGRLARLTNKTSKVGDMYDHILGQFLILVLIIPLVYHYFMLGKFYSLLILVIFGFLSPFNYFIGYFSKYTFQEVYENSIIKDTKKSKKRILVKLHFYLKDRGIKSIPSDIEAIHIMFIIVPLLLFFEKYSFTFFFSILANLILITSIIVTIYRNIQLNKLY